MEQQVLKEAELADRVIGSPRGLLAFKTRYTNADVCSGDHINVI